ncbi:MULTISPECIES: cupin domain-containing protein [Bradyrhizobium]|uniref:Cupin domain-containing protein n=2 Tax=Nitrobacteraceae TaxID=41294 RepID=A0A7Z0QBV7_9BRAD|nr:MULTISPECIES: cupin domain-containing protein [Bradyrhizobium]MBR0946576.1 cupin domain-containing protein [Bradyrhizobium liaoningense]WLB97427.1 cupin domain-containing protein [Bradyrhizobium japonicum USDA 123]MBR1002424.1 cupin domain-containing protein [Bradyrhizobium liaoningense]MCP1747139.1 mannose-6-phosphate isomerase-like protein (cupin superfamily) [Bradyrhizobium japonicum]MCP1865603.1 mannose-6-phosphate isomerase-like protein (cupin superfamily) [Bradyrhizobium japonicum]
MSRLIVTSHKDGKSSIGLDQSIPAIPFKSVPGFDTALVWGTAAAPSVPWDGRNAAKGHESVLPDVGETRLMKVTFPPDSVMMSADFDPAAAGAEYMSRIPGLAQRFEPDSPGMHTTDSVDYGILIEGEISLELDDGKTVALKPGDVVVQNGTRHAWRNPGAKPATLIFVLIGASRSADK